MEITYLAIDQLKPYVNNAKKHPDDQIKQIMKSISEFGNNDPIAVDENGIIIEGHGRYEALRQLGYVEVPVIKLEHMTTEQKRAYILAHNKLTLNSDYDSNLLLQELENIKSIDMQQFGFEELAEMLDDLEEEYADFEEDEPEEEKADVFETDRKYLLQYVTPEKNTVGYQLPILEPSFFIPSEMMGFNYVKSDKEQAEEINRHKLIHFYLDDYQFERVWSRPEQYTEMLLKYGAVLTPDFSLYMDMPLPMKLWNVYRGRMIGQIMQSAGLTVIPTVSWGGPDTYDFAFEGLPRNATLSVSTVGIIKDDFAKAIWESGMDYLLEYLTPAAIILYGNAIDYDFGKTKIYRFGNTNQERMERWEEEDSQVSL